MDSYNIPGYLNKHSDPSENRDDEANEQSSPLSKGDRLHEHNGDSLPKASRAVGKTLRKKTSELESLDKELISFSYVSSNDLQEPLRKIQTFSSRILEKELDNLSENGKEYFKRMQNAANRMQRIIDDLVVFSQLNGSNKKHVITDVGEVVREISVRLSDTIKAKKARISFKHLGSVRAVREELWQLIYNLLSNSLKFADTTRPLRIHIEATVEHGNRAKSKHLDPKKKYYHLRIEDNGIGFENKFCDRIFEVFQRLHAQDVYEGTGIGLAICKKIVDNHKGVICAEGELNKGATFDIFLPVAELDQA